MPDRARGPGRRLPGPAQGGRGDRPGQLSSDGTAADWVPFGKFTLPVAVKDGKFDAAKFADALAEGVLSRLVRAQFAKGPAGRAS